MPKNWCCEVCNRLQISCENEFHLSESDYTAGGDQKTKETGIAGAKVLFFLCDPVSLSTRREIQRELRGNGYELLCCKFNSDQRRFQLEMHRLGFYS